MLIHWLWVGALATGWVIVCWFVLRSLIKVLTHNDMVDRPNQRTLHQGAVPRGGGLIIAASIVLACLVVAVWTGQYIYFLCLAAIITAWAGLSWADDRSNLSPRFRFAVQLVITGVTVAAFGWISSVFGVYLGWAGLLLTIIGILWMANLYNFMDGMDGLAASQSIIGSITLAFWFAMAGNLGLAAICIINAASSYAFLLWNWHPARVFMGDVGSVTLGAFFATLMVIAANRHGFPIISLILIFAVFIADASITLCRRIFRREKFWLPHRTHYYQRLATLGVPHTKIVNSAILMMVLSALIATLTVLYRDIMPAATAGVLLLLLMVAVYVYRAELGAGAHGE